MFPTQMGSSELFALSQVLRRRRSEIAAHRRIDSDSISSGDSSSNSDSTTLVKVTVVA